MTVLSILATIFGAISGIANFPQALKIFRRKSAKDLSLTTNTIFLLSSIVWFLYGIQLINYPLIIANIIYILTYSLIVIGWFIYGGSRK